MREWWKSLSVSVKGMIVIIIMLMIAIITRWEYVRDEISSSVKERLKMDDIRENR